MKAVILAGGDGTRLRPLSASRPKPLAPLFGKPVLEYTVNHLKANGVTDMTATLRAMPEEIMNCFGDGSRLGVRMGYQIETEPLGTAGSARACVDPSGDGPFMVISGDGLCDFDFRAAVKFHKERRADVTILLHRQTNLLPYGLVMTDGRGRVTRFIEKPSWGQVFTDTVNTGIYIIEPRVMRRVPENTFFDFARDLFPDMLERGEAVYGYAAPGYWCDIGDTASYLQCAFDALDGKIDPALTAKPLARGVRSDSGIPAGVSVSPPCYIGKDVRLGRGARVGPYTVLTDGCTLGEGAVAERSYLDGVSVGGHADIRGAIVCKGALIGEGARLHDGCVVGDGVSVGAHAVVRENCRVWPGKTIEPDSGASLPGSLFDAGGRVSGRAGSGLTPDMALRLGAAAAMAVDAGYTPPCVAVAWQGGEAARITAAAIEAGAAAAGANAARHDAQFPSCAAYAGVLYKFPLSIFILQNGDRVELYFSGPDGLPAPRPLELRIESVAARGEIDWRAARGVGMTRLLSGAPGLYESAALEAPDWFDPRRAVDAAVRTGNAPGRALAAVLRAGLCPVAPLTNLPAFDVSDDGFKLTAIDEQGRVMSHERLLCALCVFEASRGNNVLAVSYGAPMLLDYLGGSHGMVIKREGRDPGARELMAAQPYLRDGVFMAARLAAAMATSGQTLAAMNDAVPPLHISTAEVTASGDRGAVMRALVTAAGGAAAEGVELVEGLRARLDDGWVHVTPLPGRRALRITGEGATAEIAAELCNLFEKRATEAGDG